MRRTRDVEQNGVSDHQAPEVHPEVHMSCTIEGHKIKITIHKPSTEPTELENAEEDTEKNVSEGEKHTNSDAQCHDGEMELDGNQESNENILAE